MIDWMLVVNLTFLLLLLVAARDRWLVRATDEELKRRASRRDVFLGLSLFLAVRVGLPVVVVKFDINPFVGFWGGLFLIAGLFTLIRRLFPDPPPPSLPPPPLTLPSTLQFDVPSRVAAALDIRAERHRVRDGRTVRYDEDGARHFLEKIRELRAASNDPLLQRSCSDAIATIQQELDRRDAQRLKHEQTYDTIVD
jgi:hypothetical protein